MEGERRTLLIYSYCRLEHVSLKTIQIDLPSGAERLRFDSSVPQVW